MSSSIAENMIELCTQTTVVQHKSGVRGVSRDAGGETGTHELGDGLIALFLRHRGTRSPRRTCTVACSQVPTRAHDDEDSGEIEDERKDVVAAKWRQTRT